MARGKKKEALTPEERLRAALVPDWEQPYKVPDNWCWTRLGASINLYNGDRGSNYPSKKDYQSRGIPFINAGAIVDGELNEAEFNYISEEKYNALRAGKIQQGDLLYCLRGSIGKTAIVHQEFKGAISSSLCILRTKESMLKEFLYYLLCSNVIWHQQALAENGSAQPNLSAASVMEYIIPLSPLPEQRRIVDRIESLFAKLDEAKQKAQDALDSFETRKAAILQKAFTGALTARWRKEHGVGMESWEEKTLQDVCLMKITDGTHKTPTYCDKDDGFPFISSKDVTTEKICWDNVKYIVPSLHDELYARLSPQKDDILLAKNGTTGVAAIVEDDRIFDIYVTLAVLRPNPKLITPRYLWRIVNSPICKNQFNEHLTGIGVPNLHLRDIKEVLIRVPNMLDEQTEIVRILDDLLAKEQQAKEAAEAVLEQIDLMKKSILARAFRGKLGTNDPSEESAVELMKEII